MVVVEPAPFATVKVFEVANQSPEPILTHTRATPLEAGSTVNDNDAVPPGVVEPDAVNVNVGATGVTVTAFDVAPATATR